MVRQILNGLFVLTGIGLLPWRIRNFYHLIVITLFQRHYRKLTNETSDPFTHKQLPLPSPSLPSEGSDKISGAAVDRYRRALVSFFFQRLSEQVITAKQIAFCKACTWFLPTETEQHKPFPLIVAHIVMLFKLANSIFQGLLCLVMWRIRMQVRPVVCHLSFDQGRR